MSCYIEKLDHLIIVFVLKISSRMFPTLQYQLTGLEPDRKYNVYVDIIQIDENTWKFQGNRWLPCGPATTSSSSSSSNASGLSTSSSSSSAASSPTTTKSGGDSQTLRFYMHPDSPNTGAYWMKNEIAFGKLKLTNNRAAPGDGHILLNSMHKYMPRLHVVLEDDNKSVKTFTFPQTEFIAVTAYQNADVSSSF